MRAGESWLIGNNQRLQTTAVGLFGCLTLFTHGDSFEYIDWKCQRCAREVKASVAVSIWRPPRVLVVQLKRFEFTEAFKRIKTSQNVIFPPTQFDLSEYISNRDIETPIFYDLYAVIVCLLLVSTPRRKPIFYQSETNGQHHEGTIDKGHYFADCAVDGTWQRFNDEKVEPIADVPTNSSTAYLLFYKLTERT